ncbi:PqiC family protein [Endozoicomonas sp. ALC020]|uniref:PqiC family protein n=1 Tax=unclassified Endozoicomonas TaxID=2644528 RepID=UPI003BB102C9
MKSHVKWFLPLIAVFLMSACVSQVRPFQYYTLKPVVEGESGHTRVSSIGVAPARIPGWMDRSGLIINDGGYKLIRFDNQRWGEPLQDAITRTLTQNLMALFPHSDIQAGPWLRSQAPDIAVAVDINNLAWSGNNMELDASFTLLKKQASVEFRTVRLTRNLPKGSTSEQWVESFSYLLADLSQQIEKGIVAQH